MPDSLSDRRYRFGVFEADAATGELRRKGIRIKLNDQPFQLLLILLQRPGELVTREEIARLLWPADTFVDFEHGVNSAVNRIREAIGDSAANPRFIETLARRGYRFIAPVHSIEPAQFPIQNPVQQPIQAPNQAPNQDPIEVLSIPAQPEADSADSAAAPDPSQAADPQPAFSGILTTPKDLPKVSPPVVQTLFTLFQLMYLGFYIGALANLAEIQDLLAPLPRAVHVYLLLVVTAAILIPARAFLIFAALLRAPRFRDRFLKIWTFLVAADVLWALSPFLLLHHINFGVALACTALLVYAPFVQRSLVLMGAGDPA
jgi:DNA-binding winged helix-turn-helix (wHTH) protein